MKKIRHRLGWLRSGLFWRTFILLAFLITASLLTWVASFRTVERTPRAQQIAAQVISIVTITRAALTHSAPDLRRELLFDLASNEGIRVYPLEKNDAIEPPEDSGVLPVLEADVKARLGKDTKFAGKVNDVAGFWISFKIDDDEYWLRLDRERIERVSNIQWLGWGAISLALALLGAVFISRLINQPLSRLTDATRAIAKGVQPEPLPEKGPTEIREANRSFNQMVADLKRLESDRAIILAGISHDLRTPLARMQLELELAKLSEDARNGMQSDLAQMDSIIGQFLEYARPSDKSQHDPVELSALLSSCAHEAERLPDVRITTDITPGVKVIGNATELKRVVHNLIENARRYGKSAGIDLAEIDIACHVENGQAVIEVADNGSGVPESEMERLLRPFTRMDVARGQANGSGLGLAIVDRIIKRHHGSLKLSNRASGGLKIRIAFDTLAMRV
ncbi:ATP-binding protein [Noviherbaspirillum sp. UKPF54]|uniref:ATP-binding protein n=1 Tax=Noviherbaspirillum sp. UKPF54 TaxID=2601898 RepID=UPI0011B14EFF|nr:ATP-binding protein [Noviherbaspirillum sp. UKPF54]QDZ27576.1 HAMP domain-containing protein [Noviherbaspirillum sp. UKPF54]